MAVIKEIINKGSGSTSPKGTDRSNMFFCKNYINNRNSKRSRQRNIFLHVLSSTISGLTVYCFVLTVYYFGSVFAEDLSFKLDTGDNQLVQQRQNLPRFFSDVFRIASDLNTIIGDSFDAKNGAKGHPIAKSEPLADPPAHSGEFAETEMPTSSGDKLPETESSLPFAGLFGNSNVCFKTCGMEDIQFAARRAGDMFTTMRICMIILTTVVVICTILLSSSVLFFIFRNSKNQKSTDGRQKKRNSPFDFPSGLMRSNGTGTLAPPPLFKDSFTNRMNCSQFANNINNNNNNNSNNNNNGNYKNHSISDNHYGNDFDTQDGSEHYYCSDIMDNEAESDQSSSKKSNQKRTMTPKH